MHAVVATRCKFQTLHGKQVEFGGRKGHGYGIRGLTTRITCRRKRAKPAVTGQVHAAVGRLFEPYLLVGEPVFASARGPVVACLGIGIELGA